MPPVNRNAQSPKSAKSAASGGYRARSRGGGRDSSSGDDDDSSSSVIDSEEDKRIERKKRRGEMITGGIAAVATLHAAANVYGSMQARVLREKQLADGTITKEQAKRQRYKHHMQDAASIGLAALSIKGASGKWQGAHAKHTEVKSHRQERKERHQKRLEKGVSRSNRSDSRGPSNGRGLPAPDSYGNAGGYGAGAVSTRPGYNRGYSRSLNDLSRGGYGHDPRGGYGHRGDDGYYNRSRNGDDGYDGYDVGHA